MATGRSRLLALAFTLAGIASGCAQSGPFTSRQTMVGSLKTSVSQLEFENNNLKKQVADLKADNNRIENKLSQEEEANGEISARLDDAKDLLRRQGGNVASLGGPIKSAEDDIPPPVSTRRAKNARRPPAAQINNRPDPFTSTDTEPPFELPRTTPDPGPQSSVDDDRWLPVARGTRSAPVRY